MFIASNIVQEEMIRGPWGRSLLELVDILGEHNVFVSIYENDSGPGTGDALRELAAQLPCPFPPSACCIVIYSTLHTSKRLGAKVISGYR